MRATTCSRARCRRRSARSRGRGGEAVAAQADISEEEGCDSVVGAAHAAFGPVDILVNNAALNYYVPIKDYAVNRWMRAFAVNVHAPFMLSQKVLPDMIEKGGGSIVNISSGAALGPGRGPYPADMPVRGGTMYGASKAALERFTQGLAQEVQQYGVAVTCFSPSAVVPTPGTVYHKLVDGLDDPRGEHPLIMAKAALLLATLPRRKDHRPRHLQPGDPQGVRLDGRREGPRRRPAACRLLGDVGVGTVALSDTQT